MGKKISKLQLAQKKAEDAQGKTNQKIEELGNHTATLYDCLNEIQGLFDSIRNIPQEEKLKYEKLCAIRLNWKQQAENIELEYKKTEVKTTGQGVAGIGAGVAVAALGPSAAMGIATTFGVASTGTAISALSGAAATNAALAWLGGGALVAGGGGMAAGSAFLALAGPIGWAIAGVSVVASGLMFWKTKSEKERLENIYTLISKRDVKSYELAIVELSERIKRIQNESVMLSKAIEKIKSFGLDYHRMTEAQQYELGSYVNLMEASTMLLVDPILGLRPKYTEEDFQKFRSVAKDVCYDNHKTMIISLANLLYRISLDEKDKKVLCKSLRKNKTFLESIDMTKKEFTVEDLFVVEKALEYRYKSSKY